MNCSVGTCASFVIVASLFADCNCLCVAVLLAVWSWLSTLLLVLISETCATWHNVTVDGWLCTGSVTLHSIGHSWWLAVYSFCHCTLDSSQLVVGCVEGLSLYTQQVTVGCWLCRGPATVHSAGQSLWLAVYKYCHCTLCRSELVVDCVQGLSLYTLQVKVGG
jgi:hypothetical protein